MAVLAGAVVVATAAASPASARTQSVCVMRDNLVEHLGKSYGEVVTALGVDQSGNLVQVFSSEDGTFTIAVTIPGGPTCVLTAGEGWVREQTAKLPPEELAS